MSNNNRRTPMPASQEQGGWGFRGRDSFTQARRENDLAKQRMEQAGVYRFYLGYEKSAEIVILDNSLDDAFGCYEHAIPGPGNDWSKTVYEISPKSIGQEDPLEVHPVINGETSKPYYVVFLSVLNLTPYTRKNGEVVKYSRQLLPIKRMQADEFGKLAENAMKKYGTLRGFHLKMTRGPKGAGVNSGIGTPGPLDTLEFGHFSEAELIKRFGHAPIVGQDNKVLVPQNGNLQPCDYMKIFKKPDVADIRRRYGISAPLGSGQADEDVWGDAADQALGSPATPITMATLPDDDPDLVQFG